MLAVQRTIRRISMFYRIDLKRDNAHSQKVANVMRQHEDKIRACYIDRLDSGRELKGRLVLGVHMSGASGTIERAQRLGGNLDDAPLLRCIQTELSRIPIYPERDLRGTLIYSFGVQHTVVP